MLVRALCALSALVLVSAKPVPPMPGTIYSQVVQVDCSEGKGTAFAIRDGRRISVAHVTNLTGCKINGHPVEAVQDADLDFSVVKAAERSGFRVNCGGFIKGRYYFAIGHAHGFEWQTMVRIRATGGSADGQGELEGDQVIPGMSGGPVLNEMGEVVGTVNRHHLWEPLSYSQPLAGTSVCRTALTAR